MSEDEKVKIFINSNANMSRGKYAAHAVHAAFKAAGVEYPGTVVVLGAPRAEVEKLDTTIHDAGRTELEPGTLTAGTNWTPKRKIDLDALEKAATDLLAYGRLEGDSVIENTATKIFNAIGVLPPVDEVEYSGEAHMVKVGTSYFRCECGCNIFLKGKSKIYGELFKCNACGNEYSGD